MDLSADNAGPSSQAAGEGVDALRKASGATSIWGRRLVRPDWEFGDFGEETEPRIRAARLD